MKPTKELLWSLWVPYKENMQDTSGQPEQGKMRRGKSRADVNVEASLGVLFFIGLTLTLNNLQYLFRVPYYDFFI